MAKRKKGLSAEEKREIMLNICLDTKEVYNLKDLEKLGSKAGVVSQTIKDIVQSLVDDNLIEVDKIGSGNFYWAFPSKAYLTLKQKADGLETSLAAEEKTVADLEARLAELSSTTDDSADRAEKMKTLAALQTERASLTAQVAAFAASDPDALAAMKVKAKKAKECADRWTENVWTLKSYLMDKFGKTAGEVDAMMSIPDDFDYVA